MKKLLKEISIVTFIVIMIISLIQFPVNATNEKIEIVKTTDQYLIYDEAIMSSAFQFAFSNDNTAETSTLNFINSITDSEGNNVAYVDSALEEQYFIDADSETGEYKDTYMWIKQGETISDEPVLVELDTAITQEIIDFVSGTIVDGNRVNGITTRIPVTIGQEEGEPVTEGNTTITTTVGYLQVEAEEGSMYEYQIVKLPNEDYTRFVELAKEISNFTDNANSYENISKINEFYTLYNSLMPTETTEWLDVQNNRIEQPEDARNGEEYVVWIRKTSADQTDTVVDVQFMTSVREETEKRTTETVKEEVTTTTKLPVTFDSNMILIIVLAVIIVAIIVLLVIKKKNSNKKN